MLCEIIFKTEGEIGKIQEKAENMKGKKSKSYINRWYGDELQKYINKHNTKLKLYNVKL